ncbi:hypothetical protein HDU98_005421 [Podochytrium sp. JEL0797]|nr:hypothetical protein HDU98_005421 [Podochytrium sp. JEL0797]
MDGQIVVDAGWWVMTNAVSGRQSDIHSRDTESTLEGAVMLKLHNALKSCKIVVEEFGGKLATKPEAENYKVIPNGKTFAQLSHVLYDSKDAILPNPIGGANSFPFSFKLPKSNLPPTFTSVGGSVSYSIKCTITYQETGKLFRSTLEQDAPVTISMPDSAKLKLLHSASTEVLEVKGTADKCGFSIVIPHSVVSPGDSLEVQVMIHSTPGNSKLRVINSSLRGPLMSYQNADKHSSMAKLSRPLSEVSESFPLLNIGGVEGSESVVRRVLLYVDPELALPSLEAPLLSVSTVFRLSVTTDTSEFHNISVDVPIRVVPHTKESAALRLQLTDGAMRTSAPHSARTDTSSMYSPTLSHFQGSAASSRHQSIHSLNLPEPRLPFRNNSLPTHPNTKDTAAHVSYLMTGLQAMDLSDPRFARRKSSLVASPPSEYLSGVEVPNEFWTVEMVLDWIQGLGATPDVVQSFSENGVDGAVLVGMTAEDMRDELGVQSLGLRRKIAMGIQGV